MSCVFSLDISLSATGFAVGENGVIKSHGLVPGKYTDIQRLLWIRDRVMDKVDEVKPDLVAMEGLAMRSMDGKALDRTGLAYMIRAELVTENIKWCELSPQSIKKFVVGRGGSKKSPVGKELVIKYIGSRFGHSDVDQNDVCDALGVAYVAMAAIGEYTMTIDAQREVVQNILAKTPWLRKIVIPSKAVVNPISDETNPIEW